MSKSYLASSWRNELQPEMVNWLRQEGHEVYDFRNPTEGVGGFGWSEIDENWRGWTPQEFIEGLQHPAAERGYKLDFEALYACDVCIMMRPCGVSAALELGWAAGYGARTAIYIPAHHMGEPELMYKLADGVFDDLGDLRRWLNDDGGYKKHDLLDKKACLGKSSG